MILWIALGDLVEDCAWWAGPKRPEMTQVEAACPTAHGIISVEIAGDFNIGRVDYRDPKTGNIEETIKEGE